jgi:type II secretory pathway pseudopilin PulG
MKQYTGMRKGISLVEMVIAIVLFAALATIGLKYAKSYLNTDLQAKKARTAALTDQANQLVQAYTIYKTETGKEPATLADLNATSGILNNIPTTITEMSSVGWELNTSTGIDGTGVAFQFRLDTNTSGTDKTAAQYCAIFNREFNTSASVDVNFTTDFGTAADANASRNAMGQYFCYTHGATGSGDNWIMIVVP